MTIKLILAFFILLRLGCSTSTSPTWVINPNLNAGQVVAVNEANSSTFLPANTKNLSKTQLFISSSFSTTPRIILSMIGYGQFQPSTATAKLGFKVVITSTNLTAFKYNVTTYDVTTALLHYIYLAVQLQTATFYTSMQYLTFNSTTNLANSSAPLRYQISIFPYPGGQINSNISNPQFIIQAYAIGFCLIPYSTVSYFSLNATAFNSTHYAVNISTFGNNSLTQISFSLISFDRGAITSNYSVYIDVGMYSVIGNSTNLYGDVFNASQYMFRNGMTGAVHVQFQLTMQPTNLTYYYYNFSSTTDDLIVSRGFNNRVRRCPSGYNYYEPASVLCYDICPSTTYLNTSFSLCMPCYYACKTCTASNIVNTCSSCQPTYHRLLSSNYTCLCDVGYFDSGVSMCSKCDRTCLTCFGSTGSNCITCNDATNRALSNGSCLCRTGYYQNVTCMNCSLNSVGCTSCSYVSGNFTCQVCDSTLFRTLDNKSSSCVCLVGYYQNATYFCVPCSLFGCISCIFNLSSSTQQCLTCNTSLYLILNNSLCSCFQNYILQSNICVLKVPQPVIIKSSQCGNGIIEIGQECDDNNTQNFDGCSSTCIIQKNHTCINNSTMLSYSLCFYNAQIVFTLTLVYKYPSQNSVKILLKVQAPGCNLNNLKQYLQKTVYLELIDSNSSRRLAPNQNGSASKAVWNNVSTKSIIFDEASQLLTVLFEYNASIDLSQKSLKLMSSNSIQTYSVKYFFQTPQTVLQLQQPYNSIPTTYYPQTQRQKVTFLLYAFYSLVVLNWVFFFVSFIYKRGAIAIEYMLVFQLTYLSLLDSQNVLECWGALQLAGKYTFGFNFPFLASEFRPQQLAINLQISTFNNFSCIFSLLLAIWSGALILLYKQNQEERKIRQQQVRANQSENQEKREQQSKVGLEKKQSESKAKLSKMEKAVAIFIDLYLSISFILISGFVVSLTFSADNFLLINVSLGIVFLFMNMVFWVLYIKNGNKKCFQAVSFVSVLQNSHLQRCIQLVKGYYFALYLSLGVCGSLLVFFRNRDLVMYIAIEAVVIVVIAFLLKFHIYKQTMDKIRAIFNLVILSLLISLHIISQKMYANLGSGLVIVIIALGMIFLMLIGNVLANIVIIQKTNKEQNAQLLRQSQLKQAKNDKAANISFVGQAGYRGLHYNQVKQHSGRIMMSQDFYDQIEQSLNHSIGEEKVKNILQERANQLRDLKINVSRARSLEQSQLHRQQRESKGSDHFMHSTQPRSLMERSGSRFASSLFQNTSPNLPLSAPDQIISYSEPYSRDSHLKVEIAVGVKVEIGREEEKPQKPN